MNWVIRSLASCDATEKAHYWTFLTSVSPNSRLIRKHQTSFRAMSQNPEMPRYKYPYTLQQEAHSYPFRYPMLPDKAFVSKQTSLREQQKRKRIPGDFIHREFIGFNGSKEVSPSGRRGVFEDHNALHGRAVIRIPGQSTVDSEREEVENTRAYSISGQSSQLSIDSGYCSSKGGISSSSRGTSVASTLHDPASPTSSVDEETEYSESGWAHYNDIKIPQCEFLIQSMQFCSSIYLFIPLICTVYLYFSWLDPQSLEINEMQSKSYKTECQEPKSAIYSDVDSYFQQLLDPSLNATDAITSEKSLYPESNLLRPIRKQYDPFAFEEFPRDLDRANNLVSSGPRKADELLQFRTPKYQYQRKDFFDEQTLDLGEDRSQETHLERYFRNLHSNNPITSTAGSENRRHQESVSKGYCPWSDLYRRNEDQAQIPPLSNHQRLWTLGGPLSYCGSVYTCHL